MRARACTCTCVCVCLCISGPHLQARFLVLQSRKLATGGAHLIAPIAIKGAPHLQQTGESCAAGARISAVTQTQKHTRTHPHPYRRRLFGWQELCCVVCGLAHLRQRLSCQRTGAMHMLARTKVCVSMCQRCLCLCRFRCVCPSLCACVCSSCVCAHA